METSQSLDSVGNTRSSTHAYLDYRRRMQNRLANLNNNVSNMIQESFSGIDDICQRVRECLNTVDLGGSFRKKPVNFSEQPSEYDIVEERANAQDNDEATDSYVIEKLDEDERRENETISPYATVITPNDKGDSNMNENEQKQQLEEMTPSSETEIRNVTEERYNLLENFRETILSNVVTTSYDDFDMMNKIIENINAEIQDFSQATISGAVESTEQKQIIKRPILNPRFKFSKPPPIRRPVTSPSRMSTLNPNLFSENDLDSLLFSKTSEDPFIIPDVYRKRAFTNLYQRLMVQLEANDSLMLFQKLMNRDRHKERKTQKQFYNPSSKLLDIPMMNYYPKKTKSSTNSDDGFKNKELSKKYTDSLWFSHLKGKPSSRRKARGKESRRNLKLPINFTSKSGIDKRRTKRPSSRSSRANSLSSVNDKTCPAECPCKMVVHNDQPLAPSTRCRLHWMRAKTSLAPTRKLQFLDILDDLTNRDLLPLQSEYPRKDNQPTEQEQKDIHSTYLYKLMYGKQGTKNAWKQLLEPSIECKEKNCKQCRPRTRDSSPGTRDSSTKTRDSSPKTRDSSPRARDSSPRTRDSSPRPRDSSPRTRDSSPRTRDSSPRARDSSPRTRDGSPRTRDGSPRTRDSSPKAKDSSPRTRDSSAEKSTSETKEKHRIYKYSRHEILKKLSPYMHDPERKGKYYQTVTVMPVQIYYDNYRPAESPTRSGNSRGQSPKKSLGSKDVKGVKRAEWTNPKQMKVVFDSLPKRVELPPLALQPNKPTWNSARVTTDKSSVKCSTSKSFSPKSFAPFCRNTTQQHRPIHVEMRDMTQFKKIQKDLENIKKDVDSKNLPEAERKLWATKYQKTVGQQLVSFVEHQEAPPTPVLPKYVVTRRSIDRVNNALNPTKDSNPHKNMLFNLEGLKKKNSAVQNNIQKAIHVIEAKMVDILSTDADTTNVEAFDAMEKEITGVLSLMKGKKRATKKSSSKHIKDGTTTETSLEEEVNTLSDELFKKLERILDSERSSTSVRSGETDASISKGKSTARRDEKRRTPRKEEGKQTQRKEENKKSPKKEEPKNVNAQRPLSSKAKGKCDGKNRSPSPKKQKNLTTDDNSSVDSGTPTKLSADPPSIKIIKKPKENVAKKAKLATPTSARTVSQSPTKTWDNILSMPCGDQNTEKTKKQGITNNENIIDHKDTTVGKPATQIYDNLILEKSQGDGAARQAKTDKNPFSDLAKGKPQKRTVDDNDQKLSKKVRFEEFLNEDTSRTEECPVTTSEEYSSLLETAKDDVSSSYYTPNQSPQSSPKSQAIANDGSSTSFAEQVNRIIKRVEDIYTHLDDMHNTSSEENVKKFKEKTPTVRSEIFLTPFMQAVKEKRKVPEKAGVQKSPSYYNVINFLDSLKDIQDEKPIELHTARLCYHVNVYHQPMVYDQAQIEHTAEHLPVIHSKPSCIKKIEEEQKNKQKKVHFLVTKEEKSSQATVCNFHKQKIVRISSQQFPLVDEVKPDAPEPQTVKEAEPIQNKENKEQVENDTENGTLDTEKINENEKSNLTEPLVSKTKTDEASQSENEEILDKCEEKTPKTDEPDKMVDLVNKIEDSNNVANEIDEERDEVYTIGENDKPVQVYCHVDESETELVEKGGCEKQDNLNVTKTDKSNQSIDQMNKDNNTDENIIKAINAEALYNERGINTEDMDTSEDIETTRNNVSNVTSTASLVYDGPHDMICPKVVKEQIDIRDGKYENTILNVKSSLQKLKQNKIIVFREVAEVPGLLKSVKDFNLPAKLNRRRLDKRKLMRKPSIGSVRKIPKDIEGWGENVVLLKSFYAIVYILMFTALSMDYRCM